jgi:ABC-type uncharacterized transport system substrate-binding protein
MRSCSPLPTRTLPLLMASAIWAAPAMAHPHVWVDAAAHVIFDEGAQITAISHSWRFDEAFSAYLMLGLDTDGDGTYSRQETAELAQLNVDSLAEYGYFTSMAGASDSDVIGDLYAHEFGAPRDYYLDYDGQLVTLHFTLPLIEPIAAQHFDMVILDILDPEYFVAITLVEETPVVLDDAPQGCAVAIDRPAELDDSYASILSLIPQDEAVPEELLAITTALANRIRLRCAG